MLACPLGRPRTPGVCFGRYRTVAFDGCRSVKVPDTVRNRAWLGKMNAALGVTGYPVIQLMTLCETGTRALLGAVFGSTAEGEITWARKLLHLLDETMLVLMDRGFDGGEVRHLPAQVGGDLAQVPGASLLPAAVAAKLVDRDVQLLRQPRDRRGWGSGHVIGNEPQPRQRAQLHRGAQHLVRAAELRRNATSAAASVKNLIRSARPGSGNTRSCASSSSENTSLVATGAPFPLRAKPRWGTPNRIRRSHAVKACQSVLCRPARTLNVVFSLETTATPSWRAGRGCAPARAQRGGGRPAGRRSPGQREQRGGSFAGCGHAWTRRGSP